MAAAKKKTKKKTTRRRKTPSPEEVWEGLKEKADLNNIQPYKMTGSFEENAAIEHPKFGLGIVTGSIHGKIEVVFKDGQRDLVQDRA
mgnify:CR=1 FL=1